MIFSADTQWWHMCLALAVALVLSTAIGFERQSKNKSAGMRTHAWWVWVLRCSWWSANMGSATC